jgi:ArsR family transcriptional regulator, arsenate/arsenite/antimonite-responsive transcriptional repressor
MRKLDVILKATADPTRLRLLNLLRLGNICVCDLQAVLQISQSNVSRHLAVLRHAGMVMDSRKGNRIVNTLLPPSTPQEEAVRQFLDHCCPLEPVMQADIERLRSALNEGKCRLEPNECIAAGFDGADAQVEGSPA